MEEAVWKSDELAKLYLTGVRGAIPLAAEQIEMMVRVVEAAGHPLRRVLDLGSGDGILAAAIGDRHPECELVLMDFNDTMLAAARERFQGRPGTVEMIQKDYGEKDWTQLVEQYAPFDAIVSGYSIHHQPDERKREIYEEIYTLTAPGGMFVNVEHVSSPTAWLKQLNDENFVDALHRWQPSMERREVAEKYYFRPDKDSNILTPVELQCGWLREIGFEDVDCFLKMFELAVFGGRRPGIR
jgi:tRNA (cmo5U34)-methyltransferase